VRAGKERRNQQDKTVHGNLLRQYPPGRRWIVSRESQKYGAAAQGINDGKERTNH